MNYLKYIIFLGQILESEGHDRADLEWPGKQLEVIQDAVKYGKWMNERMDEWMNKRMK